MNSDFFPEPTNKRVVDASQQTSADGGGGYSFIFHGGHRNKENEEEKEKANEEAGETAQDKPAVTLNLSTEAIHNKKDNPAHLSKTEEKSDKVEKDSGEKKHLINIKV